MKKTIRKMMAVVPAVILVAAMMSSAVSAADAGSGDAAWEVSKSKTAVNLNEDFESEVTLSLPAAEEELVSDVVFVLDKSTSIDLQDEALEMLADLQKQVRNTNAKVKVGVVIFNKIANVTGFKDLETQYGDIEAAITQKINSGTNIHAGLLAGKQLLDGDTSVDDSRKYMIFVSDGISYLYCKNDDPSKAYTVSILNGGNDGQGSGNCKPCEAAECYDIKYGHSYVPESWDAWMEGIKDKVGVTTYDYEYGQGPKEVDSEGSVPYKDRADYAINVDKSLYYSYQLYKECAQQYNVYAMKASENNYYAYGASFMEWLTGGKSADFGMIENDISYLLDSGSAVVDEIGYGDGYNFDFVDDAAALKLTVGGEALDVSSLGDNEKGDADSAYGFGKTDEGYRFVLKYYRDGIVFEDNEYKECFKWEINEAVKISAPVQLTYSVKLMNPETEAGVYGEYDADGSRGYEGLFTNSRADLYPVSSDGAAGPAEQFAKPTVSYEVKAAPEEPAEPAAPADKPDTEVPSDRTAQTGDDMKIAAIVTLMLAAAAGIAVCARRLYLNK